MDVDAKLWGERREAFYRRMLRDLETGYFDVELYPLISTLFRIETLFPTSSCAGRIVILEAKVPWRKDEVRILYKKHTPITKEEFLNVISKSGDNVWFIVQPPILHISCLNIETAAKLLNIARESGFKHSGIISVSKRGYHVELRGNEVFTVPIKINGILLLNMDNAEHLVEEANRVLLDSKVRIERLHNNIKRSFTLDISRN